MLQLDQHQLLSELFSAHTYDISTLRSARSTSEFQAEANKPISEPIRCNLEGGIPKCRNLSFCIKFCKPSLLARLFDMNLHNALNTITGAVHLEKCKLAGQCTMLPLSTKSCLKSRKLRPILNGKFCYAIFKNVCLNVLGSKRP